MTLLSTIVFALFCYGASNQIVYTSGPFNIYNGLKKVGIKVRDYLKFDLYHLLTCMICLPTWFGVALSAVDVWVIKELAFTPANLMLGEYTKYWWLMLMVDGGVASGSSWVIYSVQNWFEKTTPTDEEKLSVLND